MQRKNNEITVSHAPRRRDRGWMLDAVDKITGCV
jgi:hypothetical protein